MQVKKDFVRERLINSACSIFTAKGFTETTVSEIAAKAEVGKGTFYTYFRGKEQLVEAIVDEGMDELLQKIQEAMAEAEKSGTSTFRAFIKANLEFFSKNKAVVKFLNREMASCSSLFKKNREVRERYLLFIRNTLENEIHAGKLRKDLEPGAASSLLFGMIYSAVLHSTSVSKELSLEHLGESIVTLFKEGGIGPIMAT